ncbi:hypothetical protein Trydic_g5182 [Trypoxylus dichotomus]
MFTRNTANPNICVRFTTDVANTRRMKKETRKKENRVTVTSPVEKPQHSPALSPIGSAKNPNPRKLRPILTGTRPFLDLEVRIGQFCEVFFRANIAWRSASAGLRH